MDLSPLLSRRQFLHTALTAALLPALARAEATRPPRLLLRSGWQTVNIGDIGHTPGILRLLEEHLPGVEVRLWPSNIGDGVEELLLRRFPKLIVVRGEEAVRTAFAECDFFLHGSGSGFVAQKDLARWQKETGKPYGIYGITLTGLTDAARDLFNGAKFSFFRDGQSVATAKEAGLTCPVIEYAPDGAFGVDLRNDAAATQFLQANGLEEGRFLCVIPRLRYTPYWKIRNTPLDPVKDTRNEEMKEHDHAPLRAAIAAVAREPGWKVLVCPEDRTQMEIGKTMLIDPLPAEVKARVVWREQYWLTDQALSTYLRSGGLFGLEMHSPIMCIGNGVPAIVCRFQEQTNKGLMWRDIGLSDWLFDMDAADDVARITPTVLSLIQDPAAARAKAAAAQAFVQRRQRETMAVVKAAVGSV